MAVFESAIFWIVVAAASEIIALTPLSQTVLFSWCLMLLRRLSLEKRAEQHTG